VPGTYINAVIKAGGTPVVIPVTDNIGVISHILNEVDGLVLVGGEDVNPSFYKEQPAAELEKVDSIRDVYD
jgi:gamma-glutamyl-gamma-aminobutyrate hydrolase PuuD